MQGDLSSGTLLGAYRVDKPIGRGGMGVVYSARHITLNREVALKVLAPELASDKEFRERFVRECELAAAIDHPNVIPVYDGGEVEGVLYIAMRLVKGTDLGATLQRDGALDPDRAVTLLTGVAGALDAAQSDGLVHRDVKPTNILLEPAPEGEHVYLTDFGLTKRVSSGAEFTKAGTLLGSLDYMAPERIQGGTLDGRADVYSLACVLYQCLTGSVPFPREADIAAMYSHLNEPPPAVSAARPEVPAAMDGVVARGMAKSPDSRYSTCGELMSDARSALDGTLVPAPSTKSRPPRTSGQHATPGGGPDGGAKPGGRGRTPVVAGVVVAVVAVAAVVVLLARSNGGTNPQGSPSVSNSPASPNVVPSVGIPEGTVALVDGTRQTGGFKVDGNIVTLSADGTESPLVDTSTRDVTEKDYRPAWAPNGRSIAFVRHGAEPDTLMVQDLKPDGTPDGPPTPLLASGEGTAPAWSRDGSLVAFVRKGDAGVLEVRVASFRDKVPAVDTHLIASNVAPGSYDYPPVWSPDGTQIAFAQLIGHQRVIAVATVSPEGTLVGTVRDLQAPQGWSCQHPVWNPVDGDTIADVEIGTGAETRIAIQHLSTGGLPVFLPHVKGTHDSAPQWSPDGKLIAYSSDRDGPKKIWVSTPPPNATLRRLTSPPNDQLTDFNPAWSPSGDWIAYVESSDLGGAGDLFVILSQGGEPQPAALNQTGHYSYVTWWGPSAR